MMECSDLYGNEVKLLDGAGNSVRSEDGALYTHDFLLLVAEGKIPTHSIVHKFGRNPEVGTTAYEAIWNNGGPYTGFNATSAEPVTIVSTSALDDFTDTGLRTIRLYGLDENYEAQTEDIALSGTTPVTSTLSYIRCDNAKGLTAGTTGENQGVITIAQSVTVANVFAAMPIGYNASMVGAFTVPAGKYGYLLSQAATISNKQAAAASMRIKVRAPGNIFTVNGEAALNSTGTGYIERTFSSPGRIPPMTDLCIEGEASSTVAISVFLDILLVDV